MSSVGQEGEREDSEQSDSGNFETEGGDGTILVQKLNSPQVMAVNSPIMGTRSEDMKKARLPSSLGNSDVSQKESGYVFKEEQDAIQKRVRPIREPMVTIYAGHWLG